MASNQRTPPRARSSSVPGFVLLGIVVLSFAGCAAEDSPSHPFANDAALTVLQGLRYDYLRAGWQRLDSLNHLRIVETVALDANEDTTVYERLRVRVVDGATEVTDSVQFGSFPAGRLSRWLAPGRRVFSSSSEVLALIPDDPPYLLPVNRRAYDIRFVDSGELPRIEVRLLDADEVESDIHRATFAFDSSTQQVVVLEVDRRTETFLHRSGTIARIELAPSGDATWLPRTYLVRQRRQAPLQRPYDYAKREYFELPNDELPIER